MDIVYIELLYLLYIIYTLYILHTLYELYKLYILNTLSKSVFPLSSIRQYKFLILLTLGERYQLCLSVFRKPVHPVSSNPTILKTKLVETY